MAYNPHNLSALSYANGFTLWHYKTQDPAVDVRAPGYFNGAACMFRAGDFIMFNANVGGQVDSGVLLIAGNTGEAVTTERLS